MWVGDGAETGRSVHLILSYFLNHADRQKCYRSYESLSYIRTRLQKLSGLLFPSSCLSS